MIVDELIEETVQFQSPPQLQSQVTGAELSRPFQPHPMDQDACHLRIVRWHLRMRREQFQLTRFAVLIEDLHCLQPARMIRTVQLTQMADRSLSWTIRCAYRFHQRPIGVLLAVFAAMVRTQKHSGSIVS